MGEQSEAELLAEKLAAAEKQIEYLRGREKTIAEAISVCDGGRYVNDIVSAVQRVHRELALAEARKENALFGPFLDQVQRELAEARERERRLRSVIRGALDAFCCTQDPNIYPKAHWSNRALDILKYDTTMRAPEPQATDTEEMFYIQNKGYCGDCLTFWRANRCGYTTNIDEALKLPKTEAKSLCQSRPEEDFMLPASLVERAAHRHVNSEALRAMREQEGGK